LNNDFSGGSLQIGSSTSTGGITVNSALTLSPTTTNKGFNLQFEQGAGTFSSTAGTITLQNGGNLAVTLTSGNIKVGNIIDTGTAGAVSLQTNGAASSITLSGSSPLPTGWYGIGLLAGTGKINGLPSGTITLAPNQASGTLNGGNVFISGSNLATTNFNINVSGGGSTGNGGIASFINTATAAYTASNLTINASGANAGEVIIGTGGNFSYSGTGITANATGGGSAGTGNGATYVLSAGSSASGTLTVSSINASGSGLGSGGSITLNSNSSTAFSVSDGKFLVTAGAGSSNNGTIVITNRGGGINDSAGFTAASTNPVGSLTLSSAGSLAGTISVTPALGDANTNSINLIAGGSGSVTWHAPITATTVNLTSGTGTIVGLGQTGSNDIAASNLSANTAGTGSVLIFTNGAGTLNVGPSSAGTTLTINANNSIASNGVLKAGSVGLSSTGTNASISLNGNVIATAATGSVTLASTGTGSITDFNPAGTDAIQAKTIILASATGSTGQIGTNSTALRIETSNLSSRSTGLANINNLGLSGAALTLSQANTSNSNPFTLQSATAVTIAASSVLGSSVSINTSSGSGGIALNANSVLNATNTVSLTTATGNISEGKSSSIIGATVALQSSTGSIGAAASALAITANNLSANSTSGVVNVNDASSGAVVVSSLGTSGALTFASTLASSTTINGNVSGSTVILNTGGNTALNGNITATTGSVTLSQTGAIANPTSINGNVEANTSVTINTAGNISTNGTVAGVSSVSMTTPGSISLTGNVVASNAGTGSVSLTAGTTGSITDVIHAGSDVIQSKTVTLKNGSIGIAATPLRVDTTSLAANTAGLTFLDNLGFNPGTGVAALSVTSANSTSTFSLQSAAAVTFTPTLPGATSIVIDTSSGAGGITLSGATLGSSNSAVQLISGAGNITAASTTITGATVVITSAAGSIGTSAPLKVSTASITASSVSGPMNISDTLKAAVTVNSLSTGGALTFASPSATAVTFSGPVSGSSVTLNTFIGSGGTAQFNGNIIATTGALMLNETGTGSSTLNSPLISAGTTVTLNTVGATTFGPNVSVSANPAASPSANGAITVSESTGLLTVGGADSFQANGNTAGSITLLEKANLANPPSAQGITVGSGSSFNTLLTAKSLTTTAFPLPGQISLVVGSIPTKPVAGSSKPSAVNEIDGNNPANKVYYGSPSVSVSGAPNSSNMIVVGNSAIVFAPGTNAPISISGPSNFVADPPAASPSLSSISSSQVSNITAARTSNASVEAPSSGVQVSNASIHSDNFSSSIANANSDLQLNILSVNSALQSTSVNSIHQSTNINAVNTGATPGSAGVPPAYSSTQSSNIFSNSHWSPLSGQVSEFESSELQSGEIDAVIASDRDLGIKATACLPVPSLIGNGKSKVVELRDGTVLFAPLVNTTVKTPFGNVDIDAKSIVLLIASKHGIAVYNLDDQHRDAVRVHAGGRTLTLSPSNQAVITSKQNTAFEQVNPLETMAYRRVTDFEIGANLRAFNSEFSMLSAISTIKPLKSIVSSKHPEARRISAHLLKTAAAMVQLKAGLESYQKVPHSRLSAFLSQN